MLNMQNVKDIEITEGAVRTIHDKDNRLIWGRLAYGTKYAGDTHQHTYSGENLFDVSTFVMGGMTNGHITTSSIRITNITMPLKVYPKTTYTISVNLGSDIMGFRVGIHQLDANKSFISDSNWQQLVPNPYTFTTDSKTEFIGIVCSCSTTSTTVTTGGTENMYNASNPTQWLRGCTLNIIGDYVLPSPDAPTPVQTVTGEQTVTIGDGVDSEDFTISLGTIELCKIGDYQDYIYKSGDDWYVHKEFGKYVFNGSETIAYNSSNGGFTINTANLSNYMPNHATPPMVGLSTHFSVNPTTTTWTGDNRIGLSSNGTFWCKATSFATSLNDCLAWLTANTPSVYYALDTANDTKIMDATLVGQLNAVHEWLTRYGYTSTVTGNLPLIINQTNL